MDIQQETTELQQSPGGRMVELSWSPAETIEVVFIKRRTAELINRCDEVRVKLPPPLYPRENLEPPHSPEMVALETESHRIAQRAKMAYEEACMWAVKLAWLEKRARATHSGWVPPRERLAWRGAG